MLVKILEHGQDFKINVRYKSSEGNFNKIRRFYMSNPCVIACVDADKYNFTTVIQYLIFKGYEIYQENEKFRIQKGEINQILSKKELYLLGMKYVNYNVKNDEITGEELKEIKKIKERIEL